MTAATRHRPLLLGHRGVRVIKSIPENSLLSFDRTLADGCDGFEFDVRLAADGTAIIWHDEEFKGFEIARSSVKELTGLARLQEVLERYRQNSFLDVELKVAGLEKQVIALLEKHAPERGFVVSSFLPGVLRRVREAEPKLPLGLICETKRELQQWEEVDIEYVIPHYKLVDAALIGELKTAGKKIFVWTVNSPIQMRRFAELGVDGIISDNPSLLARTLKS